MKPFVRCAAAVVASLGSAAVAMSAMAQASGVAAYGPSDPNKAFDPNTQAATSGAISVQRPQANVVGTVPITAGPTVPIVTIDGPSLRAIPGDHWVTVLYVTNNSAAAVDPQIGCTFTNGGRSVQEARVIVPTVAAGTRLGVPVDGPRTDRFVDRVLCRVLTP